MAAQFKQHEHWSSGVAFLLAAVGSSVGLGNLWRFSAEAGANGGGAFILIYIACVLVIGIPVLMSEYIIGRGSGAASAVKSVADLSRQSNTTKGWSLLAWLGMVGAFLIVSFYCVIAGWVLAYIPKFALGAFEGQTPDQIVAQFDALQADKTQIMIYFSVFVAATAWLVSRGVNRGIEFAAKILMPLFFLMLFGLAAYGMVSGSGREAVAFMFTPDFSKITPSVAQAALGQAFFSIGIGSAIMITFGSYLHHGTSIPRSAIFVGLTDTFVALTAGLAIFPIVFSHGLEPSAGAGLFFQTLPVAVADLPGGAIIGTAFFVLAFFAAITSSISLLEPTVAWVMERFEISRRTATISAAVVMWAIGASAAFSGEVLNQLNTITGTIMLPLSGFLAVLFVGWALRKDIVEKEMEGAPAIMRATLLTLVRYVAPLFVGLILFTGIRDTYFTPPAAPETAVEDEVLELDTIPAAEEPSEDGDGDGG